eukprot:scaffold8790_cov126-Skeletonema_dohrnii-CCMP3373.AAC.3
MHQPSESNHYDDTNTCTGMSSRSNYLLVGRDSSSLLARQIKDEPVQRSPTMSYYVQRQSTMRL